MLVRSLVLSVSRLASPIDHRLLSYESGVRIGRVGPIPRDKLDIKFVRSPGPGGQNVNKVATKAEVRFRVEDAMWMPEPVRQRFLVVHASRINKEGELVVTCCEQRTQQANLTEALNKLRAMLEQACFVPKERIETEVPQSAVEVRLREKSAAATSSNRALSQSMTGIKIMSLIEKNEMQIKLKCKLNQQIKR